MAMQFTVIGRLAKDPEFKSVNDVKVLKLNVISNEKTKVGTEWKERSDGFYCDLYGPLGETMFNNQTFGKGDLVYIQGRIRNHSYVKNGTTVYRDVYIIDKVERLISMKNQANRNTSHPVSQIDESFYPDTYQPVQQPIQQPSPQPEPQMVNNNTVMTPTTSAVDSDIPF